MTKRYRLAPRHARGCPRNILRTLPLYLPQDKFNLVEYESLFLKVKEVLPCTCPKNGAD